MDIVSAYHNVGITGGTSGQSYTLTYELYVECNGTVRTPKDAVTSATSFTLDAMGNWKRYADGNTNLQMYPSTNVSGSMKRTSQTLYAGNHTAKAVAKMSVTCLSSAPDSVTTVNFSIVQGPPP